MKLYIKQKIFSWTDKFYVKNEKGEDVYSVEGELFSWGKRLHIYDANSKEVAFLKQKIWSWMPKYEIFVNGEKEAEINRKLSFFKPYYTVAGPDWEVTGDFWAHNYFITEGEKSIVSITKEWFSWGDSYVLDIEDPKNELLVLCMVLAIDADLQSSRNASSD
jgi:uncharacterized protein YxjI